MLRMVAHTLKLPERARQNMQTVSNQKTDPTKSAEGAAPGARRRFAMIGIGVVFGAAN
jgi:hypothetical protein